MQREIEKKYELTNHDYEIIKDKCSFVEDQELKDYYLDTDDFILWKHNFYLRLRNGLYELKITTINWEIHDSQEFDDEDIINEKLSEFNITIDDCTGVCFVHTQREKYEYDFNGIKFNIDIDRYQYDARYEIEIILTNDSDFDWEEKIESFRKMIWLESSGGKNAMKVENCAMHQNIGYYEVVSDY